MSRADLQENVIKRKSQRGFTIVEIIIVILLVGILSAVVMARFLSADSYNPIIARDQIISMARSAQQKAIGRSAVVLTIQPVGDQLQVRVSDADGVIQTAAIDGASVGLRGDVNQLGSCQVTPGSDVISNAAPFVLQYNQLGDLRRGGVTGTTGFPVNISSGARICLNSESAMSVCWSKTGYAYAGDCIE